MVIVWERLLEPMLRLRTYGIIDEINMGCTLARSYPEKATLPHFIIYYFWDILQGKISTGRLPGDCELKLLVYFFFNFKIKKLYFLWV